MATETKTPETKTAEVKQTAEKLEQKPAATEQNPAEKEQTTDLGDEIRDSLLGLPAKKKASKPKESAEEKQVEEGAAKAAKTAKKEEPATAKAEKAEQKQEEAEKPLKASDAAKIAEETVKAMKKAEEKPAAAAATTTKPAEPELPEAIKKDLKLYETLEELYPDKYPKGLAARKAEFHKKEVEYADKWEEANPGETFNANDPEHVAFYEKNEPIIDPEHRIEARVELRSREKYKPLEEKISKQEREREIAVKESLIAPVVAEKTVKFSREIYRGLGGEDAESLTPEAATSWAENDPVAAAVLVNANKDWLPRIDAAIKIWENVIPINDTDAHVNAVKMLRQMEAEYAKNPPPPEKNWVPLDDYLAMPDDVKPKYSKLMLENWVAYMQEQAITESKGKYAEIIAEEEKILERAAKRKAKNGEHKGKEEKVETARRTDSPSVGDESPTPPARGTIKVVNKGGGTVVDNLLGLADR